MCNKYDPKPVFYLKAKHFNFLVFTSCMSASKNFFSLLDQYRIAAFSNSTETEISAEETLTLLETVDHVKSIPDQVKKN